MTDDKNRNPETEEEFAEFEDDFVEDGLEESFHEDGEEFVEEDWEAYDEEGEFPVTDGTGKKSSKLLVIVGGLVLLGGGGYVAMQFTGGNSSALQTQGAVPAEGDVADALPMPDSSTSFGNDNSELAVDHTGADSQNGPQNGMSSSLGSQDFTPPPSDPELDFEMPMPFSNNNEPEGTETQNTGEAGVARSPREENTPRASNDDSAPDLLTPLPQGDDRDASDGAPGLMASGDSAANMQNDADVAGDDSGSRIPAWSGQDAGAVSSGENRTDSAQSAASATSATIDSNALASLETKLDSLFNRLDAIENELDQVKKPASDNDISALQSKIRKLEREIENMDSRSSSTGAASSAGTSSKSTSSASKRQSGATYSKPMMRAKDWVLTSAQPGKATLRNAKSNDAISVEVGDSVSGLGRVLSIGLEGGKWVVKATSGRISQ